MHYNLLKTLSRSVLTLAIIICIANVANAQGTVSLADNLNDGTIDSSSENNNEFSLFDEEEVDDFSTGLMQPSNINNPMDEEGDSPLFEDFSNLGLENPDLAAIDKTIGKEPQSVVPEPVRVIPTVENFGEDILGKIDDDLFAQMSDLEKQTSLLTLELRREKIKTEIEAIRIQRAKAIQDEENARELRIREKQEWESKQKNIAIAEESKLAQTKAALEEARQEKMVNAYKNKMLEQTQKWITALETSYKRVKEVEAERDHNLNDFKVKLTSLAESSKAISEEAEIAKENFRREVANYSTQIAALGTRIDTLNSEKLEGIDNPFSRPGFGSTDNPDIKLSDEYIILEITGKGTALTAKLSNKEGDIAFLVQKGTSLKSGHVIDEIAPTYIRADRGGMKDFIYFSAGGILDREPDSDNKMKSIIPLGSEEARGGKEDSGKNVYNDNFMSGMFVD